MIHKSGTGNTGLGKESVLRHYQVVSDIACPHCKVNIIPTIVDSPSDAVTLLCPNCSKVVDPDAPPKLMERRVGLVVTIVFLAAITVFAYIFLAPGNT